MIKKYNPKRINEIKKDLLDRHKIFITITFIRYGPNEDLDYIELNLLHYNGTIRYPYGILRLDCSERGLIRFKEDKDFINHINRAEGIYSFDGLEELGKFKKALLKYVYRKHPFIYGLNRTEETTKEYLENINGRNN